VRPAHGVDNNVEILAQANGIARMPGCCTGCLRSASQPSTYQAEIERSGPKYERPRKWTDPGIVCWPERSPPATRCTARPVTSCSTHAVELFDPLQRNCGLHRGRCCQGSATGTRTCRSRGEEYGAIRAQVMTGGYEYQIADGVHRFEPADA
jgi:hypothetical protein